MLNNHLSVLPRFGCTLDSIDVDEVQAKIEALKADIAEAEAKESGELEDPFFETSLQTMKLCLGWYETEGQGQDRGRYPIASTGIPQFITRRSVSCASFFMHSFSYVRIWGFYDGL